MPRPASIRRSIPELEELLGKLTKAWPKNHTPDYRPLVAELGQPDNILSILTTILHDPCTLSDIARRSYRHVNNFDKIVIVGNSEPLSYRLTLHWWQPPYSPNERGHEMIHDHRFNFWSTILAGTLTSEIYEAASSLSNRQDESHIYNRYKYIPERAGALDFRDLYEFQGNVRLNKVGTHHERVGNTYQLDASTTHRVLLPRAAATCTLVLRGPRLRGFSHIYNTTYPRKSIALQHKMFSETQLKIRLARLIYSMQRI
jgi:hypothetical protein